MCVRVCVCVCMCVCVCASLSRCVRVCVCARARVSARTRQHAACIPQHAAGRMRTTTVSGGACGAAANGKRVVLRNVTDDPLAHAPISPPSAAHPPTRAGDTVPARYQDLLAITTGLLCVTYSLSEMFDRILPATFHVRVRGLVCSFACSFVCLFVCCAVCLSFVCLFAVRFVCLLRGLFVCLLRG